VARPANPCTALAPPAAVLGVRIEAKAARRLSAQPRWLLDPSLKIEIIEFMPIATSANRGRRLWSTSTIDLQQIAHLI
jgi:hypothetical protein